MKYVLGIFAVIVLLILSIVLITNRPDTNTGNQVQQDVSVRLADELETPATTLVFTVQGEVVGQNEHQSVRMSVSRTRRSIEILNGYQETVARREVFDNTEAAYEEFLLALDKAGFSNVQDATYEDRRGTCPFGNTFVYQFREGSDTVIDTWSTSCSDDDGTFAGNDRTIRRLFERQIPEYRELTKGVNL